MLTIDEAYLVQRLIEAVELLANGVDDMATYKHHQVTAARHELRELREALARLEVEDTRGER